MISLTFSRALLYLEASKISSNFFFSTFPSLRGLEGGTGRGKGGRSEGEGEWKGERERKGYVGRDWQRCQEEQEK